MLPAAWINEDGVSLNYQFVRYATPLVQGELQVPYENGVPNFIQLNNYRVSRRLDPHKFE